MSEEFRTVDRGGYIDVYFTRPVVTTRTIVSFETGSMLQGKSHRYLKSRGFAKFRGMYKSRRKVGFERSEWTNDRGEAFMFASPSAARAHIAKEFGKATHVVDRYRIESIKVAALDHVTIYAANTDRAGERHYLSEFKEIGL